MDRATLGQKITENLAIQGQIEDVKGKLSQAGSEKAVADEVVEKGIEAKSLSDKLAGNIAKLSADLKALEKELNDSDELLARNKAKVPRLIQETPAPPVHIRL